MESREALIQAKLTAEGIKTLMNYIDKACMFFKGTPFYEQMRMNYLSGAFLYGLDANGYYTGTHEEIVRIFGQENPTEYSAKNVEGYTALTSYENASGLRCR